MASITSYESSMRGVQDAHLSGISGQLNCCRPWGYGEASATRFNLHRLRHIDGLLSLWKQAHNKALASAEARVKSEEDRRTIACDKANFMDRFSECEGKWEEFCSSLQARVTRLSTKILKEEYDDLDEAEDAYQEINLFLNHQNADIFKYQGLNSSFRLKLENFDHLDQIRRHLDTTKETRAFRAARTLQASAAAAPAVCPPPRVPCIPPTAVCPPSCPPQPATATHTGPAVAPSAVAMAAEAEAKSAK